MLELYHNNISVNAQKVRIVLAEKNLEWTGHHLSFVKGEHLTAEFKALNPRGLVPVIVHDGNVIIESSVICSYLDEVFPEPPLTPKAPLERATMRLWWGAVSAGRRVTSGGKSHSWLRPTSQSLRPSALTISVALAIKLTTRRRGWDGTIGSVVVMYAN